MSGHRIFLWNWAPDGSTLSIRVSGSDENFNVSGFETNDPEGSRTIAHEELLGGYQKNLVSGESSDPSSPFGCSVTLAVAFLGEGTTTVTVEATVTKPNGTPFGSLRKPFVTTGKKGETDAAVINAITRNRGDGS